MSSILEYIVTYWSVLFTMDAYFRSKTQQTTVKYNQQLSKHSTTPPQLHFLASTSCLNATTLRDIQHKTGSSTWRWEIYLCT